MLSSGVGLFRVYKDLLHCQVTNIHKWLKYFFPNFCQILSNQF